MQPINQKQQNPSNVPGKARAERKRVPMSAPVQKLEVPELPGYHLHWMRGSHQRIQQALQAGYEFVSPEEVHVNNVSLGGDSAVSGNTDMGSHVSIVGGGLGEDNQPVRLILMKLKEELWLEDQQVVQNRNDQVAAALTGGMLGGDKAADSGELNMRYVKKDLTKIPEMFRKKVR